MCEALGHMRGPSGAQRRPPCAWRMAARTYARNVICWQQQQRSGQRGRLHGGRCLSSTRHDRRLLGRGLGGTGCALFALPDVASAGHVGQQPGSAFKPHGRHRQACKELSCRADKHYTIVRPALFSGTAAALCVHARPSCTSARQATIRYRRFASPRYSWGMSTSSGRDLTLRD